MPAAHGSCVALVEPAGQKWPAAQAPSQVEEKRPVRKPKKPAEQLAQKVMPTLGCDVPAGQKRHEGWPAAGWYLPSSQSSQ